MTEPIEGSTPGRAPQAQLGGRVRNCRLADPTGHLVALVGERR